LFSLKNFSERELDLSAKSDLILPFYPRRPVYPAPVRHRLASTAVLAGFCSAISPSCFRCLRPALFYVFISIISLDLSW
ncbi:unnamed protein product, partial [Arabidopsis halleri]